MLFSKARENHLLLVKPNQRIFIAMFFIGASRSGTMDRHTCYGLVWWIIQNRFSLLHSLSLPLSVIWRTDGKAGSVVRTMYNSEQKHLIIRIPWRIILHDRLLDFEQFRLSSLNRLKTETRLQYTHTYVLVWCVCVCVCVFVCSWDLTQNRECFHQKDEPVDTVGVWEKVFIELQSHMNT